MTTLTRPKPTPGIEPIIPDAPPDDGNTCYVCGGAPYRECERCDKPTCKEHTRTNIGFCQIERTLCPLCDAKKRREDAALEKAYRAWKASNS